MGKNKYWIINRKTKNGKKNQIIPNIIIFKKLHCDFIKSKKTFICERLIKNCYESNELISKYRLIIKEESDIFNKDNILELQLINNFLERFDRYDLSFLQKPIINK